MASDLGGGPVQEVKNEAGEPCQPHFRKIKNKQQQ